MPLSNLMNPSDFKLERFEDLNNNHYLPIIQFFILEGFIDETYRSYTGYFHEGMLSNNDEIFLRGLLDGNIQNCDFKLDNVYAILNFIDESYYLRKGIFNKDLLNYILNISENHESKTHVWQIIETTINENKTQFLLDYLGTLSFEKLGKLVSLLMPLYHKLLLKLIADNKYNVILTNHLLLLAFSNTDFITKNNFSAFKELITFQPSTLELEEIKSFPSFFETLKNYEVKFENLDSIELTKDTAIQLEINGLYEPNFLNIHALINAITESSSSEKLILTLIFSNPNFKNIKTTITKSYEKFVNEYLKYIHSIKNEKEIKLDLENNEAATIYLLNSRVDIHFKLDFIDHNNTIISNIRSIKNLDVFERLIEQKKISYSDENLLFLFNLLDIPMLSIDIIIDYLNSSTSELNIDIYNNSTSKYLPQLLINNKNTNALYFDEAINKATIQITKIDEELFKKYPDRINSLISQGLVEINKENISSFIQQPSNDFIRRFAAKNGDDVGRVIITLLSTDIIKLDTITNLVNSSSFSVEMTKELIQKYGEPISLYSVPDAYSEVRSYIISENFAIEDIDKIILQPNDFDLWDEFDSMLTDDSILNKILDSNLNIDFIKKVINNNSTDSTIKVDIISKAIENNNLTKDSIIYCLSSMNDLQEIATVFNNKRPKIETSYQQSIANALEKVGLVSISSSATGRKLNLKTSKIPK